MLSALLVGALIAAPTQAASGNVVVHDKTGDGQPDIVRLGIIHTPATMATVKVRVRNVRSRLNNELWLYVDPSGKRRRPSYAYVLSVSGYGDYAMRRTRGWKVTRHDLGTCGETIRLRTPHPRVRVVVFKMPGACFGDVGARFAVRTRASDRRLRPAGTTDWAPSRRTLSPTFYF